MLFSFLSRYYCTIGLSLYLVLEVCVSHIPAGISTRSTQVGVTIPLLCVYVAFTLYGIPFQGISTSAGRIAYDSTYNTTSPIILIMGFGLDYAVFTRRYWRYLNLISFPAPTKMFQSGAFPIQEWIDARRHQDFPLGHPRFQGSLHLPEAYRSLARPSSASEPSHPPDGIVASISLARPS